MAADFCEEYYIYGRKNYGLCQGEFQGTELGSADHSLKAVCSGREHRGGQDQRKGSAEAGVSGFERDLGIAERRYSGNQSLDRLSRNKAEMKQELKWFQDNGITLKIIDLPTTMLTLGDGQEWIRDK